MAEAAGALAVGSARTRIVPAADACRVAEVRRLLLTSARRAEALVVAGATRTIDDRRARPAVVPTADARFTGKGCFVALNRRQQRRASCRRRVEDDVDEADRGAGIRRTIDARVAEGCRSAAKRRIVTACLSDVRATAADVGRYALGSRVGEGQTVRVGVADERGRSIA